MEINYYSAKQMATMLGVSGRTIRRMANDRLIPHYHISTKLIRFRIEEVKEALGRVRIPARSERKSDIAVHKA